MLRRGHPCPPCHPQPCPQHPPDVILVPALRLLDDELRVEEHEAAHDHQSHVQVGLQGEKRAMRWGQSPAGVTCLSVHPQQVEGDSP